MRPEAIAALRGSERILHAGDIGKPSVLDALAELAPVDAIRGNNDTGEWARDLPEVLRVAHGGVSIYVLHDVKQLDFDPEALGIRVVVSGHSHRPGIREQDGVLYVNPGSAGPRRFKLPISVATLRIARGRPIASIVELSV